MRNRPAVLLVALAAAGIALPAAAGGYRFGGGYGHHRHGHHHRARHGFGLSLSFGHPAWSYPAPYLVSYPAAPIWVPGPVAYAPGYRSTWGRIETDVKPDSAAVYLDGRPVGIADDFNGWPGKLDVEPGRHELEFREVGYRTLRVTVDVLPRHEVRVRDRLVPGDDDASYRTDRYRDDPGPAIELDRAERGRPGLLVLSSSEPDATLYVDGRSLGTARDGRWTVELAPGRHRVEIVKPGYDVFSADVSVRAGARQEVDVRLEPRARDDR